MPAFCLAVALGSQLDTLNAQSSSTFHVLDLDGKDGCVELPANLFTNNVVTVEGWVKWRAFGAYSRFFEFGDAALMVGVFNFGSASELTIQRVNNRAYEGQTMEKSPADYLSADQWRHVAMVAGTNFVKLYVNGALVATENSKNHLETKPGPVLKNFLGRSVVKEAGDNPDFNGQMAEIRLWAGERTAEEIRTHISNRLTGREPGLLALWNFADGTARDASPNGRDGILSGGARVTEGTLPIATALAPWSRLVGRITDANGKPAEGVTFRASLAGVELACGTNRSDGAYSLRVWTAAGSVDLEATSPKGLAVWRSAVPLIHSGEQTADLVLKPAINIAGRATALDGKTPHASLVVELVQPEGGPGNTVDARAPQSLANRVLNLPGTGSYAVLPSNVFDGINEGTIEGWVRWTDTKPSGQYEVPFSVGNSTNKLFFACRDRMALVTGTITDGHFEFMDVPYAIQPGDWLHWAMVTGPGGMQLYVNGVLSGTNNNSRSFDAVGRNDENFLGRDNYQKTPPQDTSCQLAEVRIWRTRRTPEQIRQNLTTRLTGKEPGLFALWNFDDPTNPGHDASPGAYHGKLMGQATITNSALPVVVSGTITDAAGKPLSNARVEIHQAGQADRRVTPNAVGEYTFTIAPATRCDLFVTTGELSAYRLGFQLNNESRQQLDWVLTETGAAAAPRSTAATNGVLRVAGTNSFVELPQNLLAGARELTFEAWLKWDESDHYPTVFALGEPSRNMVFVMDTGNKNREAFGLQYENGSVIRPSWVGSPDSLELHQWRHVAAVASTNGMRLYLNGTLVMTNAYTGALFTNGPIQRAFLGRDVEDRNNHFRGEMADVRFWKTARTAEQIRENIGRRLSGNEEGLVGLWNFDDPANPGRDASPGAYHGKFMGQAYVTNAALPVLVSGRITDVSGKPLPGASVEVRRLNGTEYRFTASRAGEYAFTMAPTDRCDIFVTTGELSAHRLGFQLSGDPRPRLNWVLTATGATGPLGVPASAGTVIATRLTDEQGNFEFPNVPPGAYQVRAQIPGGRAWHEAGRILFADPDATETERARLAKLDFQLAPFNKGRWKKFGVLDGLRADAVGRILFASDGTLWNQGAGGLARFDGREFSPLSSEQGMTAVPNSPLGVHLDANGMFWMATSEGLWRYHLAGDTPAARFSPPDLPTSDILEISGTSDGAIWWRTFDALVRYQGGQGTVFTNFGAPSRLRRKARTCTPTAWRPPEIGFG